MAFASAGESAEFLSHALKELVRAEPDASVALLARHPEQARLYYEALANAEVHLALHLHRQTGSEEGRTREERRASLAAVESHQQRADALAACLEGQQAAIFVIGMSHHLHQARRCAEAEQFEPEASKAFVLRNRRRNALIQQSGRICIRLCRGGRRSFAVADLFSLRWSLCRRCQGANHQQTGKLQSEVVQALNGF